MNSRNIRRGDVFYADIPDIEEEGVQGGIRPVVVTQSNWLNIKSPTVIITCLTSQIKNEDMECHFTLPRIKGLPLQTMVLGEQRRTIKKSELLEYRCHLGKDLMKHVTRAIRAAEREEEEKPKRPWK